MKMHSKRNFISDRWNEALNIAEASYVAAMAADQHGMRVGFLEDYEAAVTKAVRLSAILTAMDVT